MCIVGNDVEKEHTGWFIVLKKGLSHMKKAFWPYKACQKHNQELKSAACVCSQVKLEEMNEFLIRFPIIPPCRLSNKRILILHLALSALTFRLPSFTTSIHFLSSSSLQLSFFWLVHKLFDIKGWYIDSWRPQLSHHVCSAGVLSCLSCTVSCLSRL